MTKKILSTLLLLVSVHTSISAANPQWEESQNIGEDAYKYVSVGLGPVIFLPTFSLGYRQRILNHGYDVSLNATTAIQAHIFQGMFLYHFYPNPFREDPWYFGTGVATSLFFENHGGAAFGLSPDFVIGKQLKNKNFVELHIQAPTWVSDTKIKYAERVDFPLTYLKYGIAF